jgi:hypothetical protein
MCGRIRQSSDRKDIQRRFPFADFSETVSFPPPRYNAAPTQSLLAIRLTADAKPAAARQSKDRAVHRRVLGLRTQPQQFAKDRRQFAPGENAPRIDDPLGTSHFLAFGFRRDMVPRPLGVRGLRRCRALGSPKTVPVGTNWVGVCANVQMPR